MKSLYRSNVLDVESAYIITVKGNKTSEEYSNRCQLSCEQVGMPYKVWDAFDGTSSSIVTPAQCKTETITQMVKVTDHYMTKGEVACALSHISLWAHCAMIDRPIVILEHDAVMVKKFSRHESYNTVVYLGGSEWHDSKWPIMSVPPHASEGPNYLFICRAHAYSIDPIMAKNLLAHVIKMGICAPLDIMMRADLFNITHQGLYAYDKNINKTTDTTIAARPTAGRTTSRNDNLAR